MYVNLYEYADTHTAYMPFLRRSPWIIATVPALCRVSELWLWPKETLQRPWKGGFTTCAHAQNHQILSIYIYIL